MGNTRTLQPFTKGDPRAVAAGKKSVEARRAKREATALVKVVEADAGAELVDRLITRYERAKLGEAAAAAAQHLIARLSSGEIPIKDATDLANVLKVLFDMTRLEEGKATSHSMNVDTSAVLARIEALRGELTTTTTYVDLSQDEGTDEPTTCES